MIITGKYPNLRLRRNRNSDWSRRLVRENTLSVNDLILPIFLVDGNNKKQSIKSMPDIYRYSVNRLSEIVDKAVYNKIPMVALFPYTQKKLKNNSGSESLNEDNLVCKAIQYIKKKYKNSIGIMCDVALDPYTSHGHDGLLSKGKILNDETIKILIKQDCKVTVLCEAPHYPKSKYYPGYKNSWLNIEKKSPSLTILRSKAFASDRKTTLKKFFL